MSLYLICKMQVVVFDKFFKCLYHLQNIPNDWNFKQVGELLELQHPYNEYQAFRLHDADEFYIDNYIYKDGELISYDKSKSL